MSDKLHIVPVSHPAFNAPIQQFEFESDVDRHELVKEMTEIMQKAGAAGLAANQLGLEHRVFVLNTEPDVLACFNPRIVHESEEYAVLEEGCLSYPGMWVKIRRPSWIRVRFQDVNGVMQTENLNKMPARAFMHELDHLDGVNYLMRAKKIHLDKAKRKMKLIDRKLKRMQLA
jgi:peptide deformylase